MHDINVLNKCSFLEKLKISNKPKTEPKLCHSRHEHQQEQLMKHFLKFQTGFLLFHFPILSETILLMKAILFPFKTSKLFVEILSFKARQRMPSFLHFLLFPSRMIELLFSIFLCSVSNGLVRNCDRLPMNYKFLVFFPNELGMYAPGARSRWKGINPELLSTLAG